MYSVLIGVLIYVCITGINSKSCDQGWLEYQGICLKHYSRTIHWTGAYRTCLQLRNAILATIDSPEPNMFIENNLTKSSDVWIGLSIPDISKPSWKWSDGGNTSYYDDWNNAGVTSACAVMKYDNSEGHWYTRPCTYESYFVCEKDMTDDHCSGWFGFETHCYLFIKDFIHTSMAAARNCWQSDAYLVSINSQQEADFIYSNIELNREYWIGLSPLKWVNDAPYQWNNWDDDSGPSITDTCVLMNATSGKWFYEKCGSPVEPRLHHSYICQKDAVIDFSTTSNVAIEEDTSTSTVLGELHTTESDALNISNIQSLKDNSKDLLLTTVVPAVCVGLVAIIVVIVVVIVIRRRRRHVQTKDSYTPSAGDTERNTYEQLSVGPYVNSGHIQEGTYASLQ